MGTTAKGPVVIVFHPDLLLQGKRLFAMDTGAFYDGRYAPWLHQKMRVSDFELDCSMDMPQKYVAAFFDGSNLHYLLLKVRSPALSHKTEFEVESFVALLMDRCTHNADDRKTSPELQVDQSISLRYPLVKAIILPEEMRQAPLLKSFASGAGAGIEMRGYHLSPNKPAIEYQALLEDTTRKLQEGWGLL